MIDAYDRVFTKLANQPVTEEELRKAKNMATLGQLAPIPLLGKSDAITALGAPEGRRMDTVLGAREGASLGTAPGALAGSLGGAILGRAFLPRIARHVGVDEVIDPKLLGLTSAAAGSAMGSVPGIIAGRAIGARAGIENRLREKRPGVPMSKEAMIEIYAPETGYIPAKYERVLLKEAGLLTTLAGKAKSGAKSLMGSVKNVATDIETRRKTLGSGAGLLDKAKFYGAKGLGAMANNPMATAAAAGTGAAGLGAGFMAGRASKPNQQQGY